MSERDAALFAAIAAFLGRPIVTGRRLSREARP